MVAAVAVRRLAWLLLATPMLAAAQAPSSDSLRKVLGSTTFVFSGTVLMRGATADSVLPPSSQHATVMVNRTLVCPADVGDITGKVVTVNLIGDRDAPIGAPQWFFAAGWVLGDAVAVDRIASYPVTLDGGVDSVIANLRPLINLDPIAWFQDRVRSSALAGVVRVKSIQASTGTGEHDQSWSLVTVTVDSLIPFTYTGGIPDTLMRGQDLQFLAPNLEVPLLTLRAASDASAPGIVLLQAITSDPGAMRSNPGVQYYSPDYLTLFPLSNLAHLGTARPMPGYAYLPPIKWCTIPP